MDIAVKKIELIEWLAGLQDKSLLEQVDSLKKKTIKQDFESNLKPMTSDEFKYMLDRAEQDLKNGKVTSQEALKEESKNW